MQVVHEQAPQLVETTPTMGKKLAYSANQLGINMLWQGFNTVAVFYYVTQLHVSGGAISTGLIVYGIVNGFLNLWAGHLSDRTRSRLGRRIPYIMFGSLPLAVCFYFLFSPPHIGVGVLLIYFLALTFLFDLFFTFTALNIGALYPEMYKTKRDRSYVSAYQQLFGIVGLIAGVALSKSLGQLLGWGVMAGLFAIVSVISLYISLYGSVETGASDGEQAMPFRVALRETFSNRRFVYYVVANFLIQLATTMFTSLSSFYTKYVVPMSGLQSTLFLGLIFIVAVPLAFIWARLAIRLTTAKAVLVATFLYAILVITFLFLRTPISVIIAGAAGGIPISGFMVLLNILIADVIDHDEKRTGRRREGMYLGMNGFIIRIGMSVQYAIMGIFFAISGYDAQKTVQPLGAIHGLRILMGGVPLLIIGLAFVALLKYQKTELASR